MSFFLMLCLSVWQWETCTTTQCGATNTLDLGGKHGPRHTIQLRKSIGTVLPPEKIWHISNSHGVERNWQWSTKYWTKFTNKINGMTAWVSTTGGCVSCCLSHPCWRDSQLISTGWFSLQARPCSRTLFGAWWHFGVSRMWCVADKVIDTLDKYVILGMQKE